MSVINILELRPAGSELFEDSESYLSDLSHQEMTNIAGMGGRNIVVTTVIDTPNINSQVSFSIGISLQSLSLVTRP